MIRIKDHKQLEIFDPWEFLSPKRRQLLDQSWPGMFKQHLLTELPVNSLMPYFTEAFGRPTKELYTVLGTLVFQQTFDLTDEEACDQLAYNIQWHYALNITEESDSAKYICPKTLWSMRSRLIDNGLDSFLFEAITKKLAKVFNVDTDKQRIDSVHIKSNMRRLGRINIFASAIHKFIKNLKRQQLVLFESIDPRLIERYLPEKSLQCFSMVKPSETPKTLEKVSRDLFDLVRQFENQPDANVMHSYKQLSRVLQEQCNLEATGGKSTVSVKPPKEIPSDSLQNPSDPDATYSGHKGQGYSVQIMETYIKSNDQEVRDKSVNLITHVEVTPSHKSDAGALLPAIDSAREKGLGPKEVLADSLYGSDENCQEAQLNDVEVVAPVMGSSKYAISLADFTASDDGKILACPQGHSPVTVKKKKTRYTTAFNSAQCEQCACKAACPVKKGKKHHYLRYTEKQSRVARRRTYEHSSEFKDRYRWRAGVEATMSEYDRRTGAKRLRVRGLKAVRFCATLKALGINLLRAAVAWMVANGSPSDDNAPGKGPNHVFLIVKEHFFVTWRSLKAWLKSQSPNCKHMIKTTCF
jgi:hypothetical protein